jgi:hypothetical protein
MCSVQGRYDRPVLAAIGALRQSPSATGQARPAVRGYEFPYCLKSTFGATRCGRRWRAVLARPSTRHTMLSRPVRNRRSTV